MVVQETEKYHLQKNRTVPNLSALELKMVLGMFFCMGLTDIHSVRAYWETGTLYALAANVMSRTRFERVVSRLPFLDNNKASVSTTEDKI